ncbi:MAG: nucleotidyltransferase family protein [Ornithinimicrobium sp.]
MPSIPFVVGLLLAAGEGSRMGRPKAAVELAGQTMLERSVETLLRGGCGEVQVVLGAGAEGLAGRVGTAAARWGDRVSTVECVQWQDGVSASLRTGLASLAARGRGCPVAVLVHLVDLPDVGSEVVERVLEQGGEGQPWSRALVRAAYDGRAGHPALIGQGHWQGAVDSAQGDRGAGRYLREHQAVLVECGDLAAGRDVDTPQELSTYQDEAGRASRKGCPGAP